MKHLYILLTVVIITLLTACNSPTEPSLYYLDVQATVAGGCATVTVTGMDIEGNVLLDMEGPGEIFLNGDPPEIIYFDTGKSLWYLTGIDTSDEYLIEVKATYDGVPMSGSVLIPAE